MRYQVPQFVDIEDKIIGPLTLKQFLIYFITALGLIPVYLFTDLSLFITLVLPVGAVAAAFAHLKPGGKSLFVFVINAAGFATKGRVWLWGRDKTLKLLPVAGIEIEEPSAAEVMVQSVGLQQKAQAIETGGNVSQTDLEDPFGGEEKTPNPNDQ